MKIKKDSINLILIIIYILLNTSVFVDFSIPIIINTILLLLLLLLNKEQLLSRDKSIFLVVCMSILVLISILVNNGGLGSFFNLFNFIIGILIFNNISFKKQNYRVIFLIIMIIYVKMLILAPNIWEEFLYGRAELNPNSVAQNLLLCNCIIHIYLKNMKKKHMKLILILFTIITTLAIYKCNSRTALLALIVYIIFTYVPLINSFAKKNIKLILIIFIVIGIAIPYIYVNLYQNDVNFVIPFSNKSLYTGREVLWSYLLSTLDQNKVYFLLGVGTKHETEIGIIENYHNWYLGVLYTFGFIIYILYFKYLLRIIAKTKKNEIIFALITIFIIGFFETSALWINTQVYILLLLLFTKY